MTSRESVLATVEGLVRAMAAEWDFDGEVTPDTQIFGGMNWQSVDFVVLANDVQDHYGRPFPFAELLQEFGSGARTDLTVGEFADFVHRHLAGGAAVA